MVQLSQFYGY